MAVGTVKRLVGPSQPGTSNATAYTVPGATTTIVKEIIVTNTTATAATVSVSINASAATAANNILGTKSVNPNDVLVFALSTVMNAADTIQWLQGTASACTITISGIEFA